MTRAFYRDYVTAGRRAGQVTRLHVIRETPVRGRETDLGHHDQAECGTFAGPVTKSNPVVIDPMPAIPPDGLAWCPTCIGRLAGHHGLLNSLAARLATGSRTT